MYLLKVGALCFHTLRQVESLQKLQLEKISVLFFTFAVLLLFLKLAKLSKENK